MRNKRLDERGFTLLETLIAMAIMIVALSAILAVESGSINASARAKQMNVVAMLARNAMIETEAKFQGKKFEEVKKEDGGAFAEPYQDYQWKAEVKELKLPNLVMGKGGGGAEGEGSTESADRIAKLVTQFLSKATREVTVTVLWKKGGGEQSFSVSTYWVDLNHEFQLSE